MTWGTLAFIWSFVAVILLMLIGLREIKKTKSTGKNQSDELTVVFMTMAIFWPISSVVIVLFFTIVDSIRYSKIKRK